MYSILREFNTDKVISEFSELKNIDINSVIFFKIYHIESLISIGYIKKDKDVIYCLYDKEHSDQYPELIQKFLTIYY